MNRQTLIALGIAVVLALVAVYLANVFLTQRERRAEAVEARVQLTKVAVAAVPLDYGVEITPEKVRFVDYPAASLPPGSFRTINELMPGGKRRVALRPMMVNEPILAAKLSGEGQGASLAAILPDGMRAATVRINDVSGVAGFIQPNDAVDVLITRDVAGGDRARQATDVLLQNVKVLAMGANAKSKDGEPIAANSATLEVDPLAAQKLALGQQVGQLSLVLRKPGEQENLAMVETVSLEDLRYSLYGARPGTFSAALASPIQRAATVVRRTAPRPAPRATVPQRPAGRRVEVIRGTEGHQYEVGDYGS